MIYPHNIASNSGLHKYALKHFLWSTINLQYILHTFLYPPSAPASSLKCLFRPYMVKAMGRSVTLAPTDVWNLVLSPYTAEKGRWSLLIALLLLLFIFTVVDTNNDINRTSHPSTFKHATECPKGQRSELRWRFCNTGEYKMYLLLLSDYVHFSYSPTYLICSWNMLLILNHDLWSAVSARMIVIGRWGRFIYHGQR